MNLKIIKRPKVWKLIQLPNYEQIISAGVYTDGSDLSRFDLNHNIYRLNAQGEVIWQVQRDEGDRPLLVKKMRAYERGELVELVLNDPDFADYKTKYLPENFTEEDLQTSWLSLPFMSIWCAHPDGTVDNMVPNSGMPPDVSYWKPGDVVYASALDGFKYIVDIETGMATNVSPSGGRPW